MISQAIDYFPFNTDFFDDDKIALIEGEFGPKGSYVAVRLLCKIFATDGYYYQWGEDACLLFTKKLGGEFLPALVADIVRGLVRRAFFDKGIFETFQVLTSRGIQNRYFDAVRKRRSVSVRPELLLVDVSKYGNIRVVRKNDGNFGKNDGNFGKNDGNFQQSRVEYSKEEESSYSSLIPPSPTVEVGPEEQDLEKQQQKVLFEFFFRNYQTPEEETRKFLAFNNTGKRKWAKMDAEQRSAALQLWRQTPAQQPRFPDELLAFWLEVFYALVDMHCPADVLQAALSDEVELSYGGGELCFDIPLRLYNYIEREDGTRHLTQLKPIIYAFWASHGLSRLSYVGKLKAALDAERDGEGAR